MNNSAAENIDEQHSHNEQSEYYAHVILKLGNERRVIQSKDNIQWIMQCNTGSDDAEKRYRNLSYIRTKNLLIDVCRGVYPQINQSQLTVLDKLPDVCGN